MCRDRERQTGIDRSAWPARICNDSQCALLRRSRTIVQPRNLLGAEGSGARGELVKRRKRRKRLKDGRSRRRPRPQSDGIFLRPGEKAERHRDHSHRRNNRRDDKSQIRQHGALPAGHARLCEGSAKARRYPVNVPTNA
jgi:hypothetical protein